MDTTNVSNLVTNCIGICFNCSVSKACKDVLSSLAEPKEEMTKKESAVELLQGETMIDVFHEWIDFFSADEKTVIELRFIVPSEKADYIQEQCNKALTNWLLEECEDSILIDENTTQYDLMSIPVYEYVLRWLNCLNCNILEVS